MMKMNAQAIQKFATFGSSFHLVQGEVVDEIMVERSMAFQSCGTDTSCSHVARLKQDGRFILITTQNSPINKMLYPALWIKEQPSKCRFLYYKYATVLAVCPVKSKYFHILGESYLTTPNLQQAALKWTMPIFDKNILDDSRVEQLSEVVPRDIDVRYVSPTFEKFGKRASLQLTGIRLHVSFANNRQI